MENASRDVRLRAVIGVIGLVVVAAAIWATAALAGGGSADGRGSDANREPGAVFTQEGGSGPEDCPDHEGRGEPNDDAADV
jgi:hypothetical protein